MENLEKKIEEEKQKIQFNKEFLQELEQEEKETATAEDKKTNQQWLEKLRYDIIDSEQKILYYKILPQYEKGRELSKQKLEKLIQKIEKEIQEGQKDKLQLLEQLKKLLKQS